jgi:hypothetical protein
LLGLEGSVRLGAIVREAVDAIAGGGEGRVFVAEGTGLFGTCCGMLVYVF